VSDPVVISHFQAAPLLRAHAAGAATATTSPDLALTTVEVTLDAAGVRYPTGEAITWDTLRRIAAAATKCFRIVDGEARDIQVFSTETNWLRGLMPTPLAPTMLVSGIAMHRIKGTDPHHDTLTKIAAIAPLTGRVLDTATGLGYTAIEAARAASEVVTVELDPAALDVARQNPWSRDLFTNPRIRQLTGDIAVLILTFDAASFSHIIHDPPMFSLAGDLYSADFYRQLHRVLRPSGRLFHYIGDPQSTTGKRTTSGVIRRLGDAGFRRVVRHPEAFGVVAYR
jgi:hypothetical protein